MISVSVPSFPLRLLPEREFYFCSCSLSASTKASRLSGRKQRRGLNAEAVGGIWLITVTEQEATPAGSTQRTARHEPFFEVQR